jgi:hypothetical protein
MAYRESKVECCRRNREPAVRLLLTRLLCLSIGIPQLVGEGKGQCLAPLLPSYDTEGHCPQEPQHRIFAPRQDNLEAALAGEHIRRG